MSGAAGMRVLELESRTDVRASGVVWRLAAVVAALGDASLDEAASRIDVTRLTAIGPMFVDAPCACQIALDDGTRIELDAADGYRLRFSFRASTQHTADAIARAIGSTNPSSG